jgi:hypothetical protein
LEPYISKENIAFVISRARHALALLLLKSQLLFVVCCCFGSVKEVGIDRICLKTFF